MIEQAQTILVVGMVIVWIWLGILTYIQISQKRFLGELTEGITKKDLLSLLKGIAASLKKVSDEINLMNEAIRKIQKADMAHIQKIGFVRYNPFADTGGNQSFCVSLLDGNNNGIVMTSLHSREQTRIYSKEVTNGRVQDYTLSTEEEEVLKKAMKDKFKRV